MSAAPNFKVLQILMTDTVANEVFISDLPDRVKESLLYLTSAICDGTYCDFAIGERYYASTNSHLNALACRPLLQPWLEEREWSDEEVENLLIAHQVAQRLEGKT